ncbi:T9SS type A sorting domain-containing protein [Hymenobacter sp. YC55]|uniref:T9SS type A sorting domain-containing protein n=1 Tax=Hymenobacter sp. YC55 TaxID=3034019 RepID=UPI0023F814BA|nr:T9SS type A sorting domain-containing protein [Hymenobacter sp. YC55]MDF7814242.1 T9SS type A sorting domain-containing protein [Hymenobacter sp. YC55]
MRTTLRFAVLLLAWLTLLRTDAWAQACTTASTLNYANAATGDRRTATQTVGGTSFTFSDYTSTVLANQTNTFAVGTNGNVSGQTLVWQLDNAGVAGTNSSSVTLTFTRPVSNLTFQFQDIDSDVNFIDDLVFEAYVNGSTTPATLDATNFTTSANNEYVSGGRVRGKNGNVGAGNTAGNLTARMPANVTKLVLYYNNSAAYTANTSRLQTLGINAISWCAQADVYARFTSAPNSSVTGQSLTYTAEFGNNGPDASAAGVVRQVTVPTGAVITNAGGGTISGSTITFPTVSIASGTSTSVTYTYTAPTVASEYNNVATVSTTTQSSEPTDNNTATSRVLVTSATDACAAPLTVDFAGRANGENWKNRASEGLPAPVSATKVGTSNYAFNDTEGTLQVGTLNNERVIVWSNNFTSTNGSNSIQFNFSRPISNFSVEVADIDASAGLLASDFRDRVTFAGSNTAVTPSTAVTPTLTSSGAVTVVGATATGVDDGNANTSARVWAYFPLPITTLTITYGSGTLNVTNPDAQTIGIVDMTWCRQAPVALNVTNSATIPATAGQVGIDNLNSSVDGTVQEYIVTAIPDAAAGILYYNSTGTTYAPVGVNQVLTPTQAASLRFDPAATATATSTTFQYRVRDDAGTASTGVATYTIPLRAVTACAGTSTLSFAAPRALGQEWKGVTESVPASSSLTTVTSGSYQTPASATASTFQTATFNGVQTLQWQTDYASTTANSSSVTFTFNRPVSNFTVRVQDIDRTEDGTNSFIDRVIFSGANAGTAVVPVLSPVGPNVNTVIISGNTATGSVANTDPNNATVVAYFADPITTLTLTYSNISTASANPTANAVGIDFMDWCRLAPVANDITNTSVSNAVGQVPVNSLSSTVDGSVASYTLSTIPPAAQGVLYVNGVAVTTTRTLTALEATQLTFDPAVTYSGTASFTYTVTDDANVSDQTPASYTIPVSNSGAAGTSAACANPGRDGSPTALTTNPNTYFPGTASAAANATTITVGAASGTTPIAIGDLLLVIQMQGADINATNTDAYGDGVTGGGANGNLINANFTAGTYEYVVANSAVPATGGTIQLASALKNAYTNAAATATSGQRRFQVIRVPQYENLTLGGNIVATPWNGSVGGIIVIDVAKQLNLNGNTINASGAGFRGGAGRVLGGTAGFLATDYRTATTSNASKGEGTAGTPRYVNSGTAVVDNGVDGYPGGDNGRGAPGNAGGGGTDANPTTNDQNTGGGGGANGGSGGRGGNAWTSNRVVGGEPGATFSAVSSSRLVLGGGGGAGVVNNNTPYASSGSAGGGIVMVRTGTITGTGSITANGVNVPDGATIDGSGGGGAGGSILVTAATPAGLSGLTLTANGGKGGNNSPGADAHGPGGGGGGGVVLTNGSAQAVNVLAGANGVTNSTNNSGAYGAQPGLVGATNTQISRSIANSVEGANCLSDVATTLSTTQTSVLAGASITYTAQVQNLGPQPATTVAPKVQLPAGLQLTTANLPDGGTYDNNTGLVTLPSTNALASGTTLTYRIVFNAPNYSTTIQGVASSTSVSLDGTLTNNDGSQSNARVTTVVTLPANGCAGTPYGSTASSGLYTEFYAGYFADNMGYFAANTPALTRVDGTINFPNSQWGNIVPPAGGTVSNPDRFSTRHRGSINIATAGTYTFYLTSDDASYLWLDGAALAATPTTASATLALPGAHSAVTVQKTVTLSAGSHNLLIFYGEDGGDNHLVLEYSSTTANIARQVVPNSVLCASLANVPPVALNVTNSPAIPTNAGPTTIASLAGTDQDGTVTNYAIASLPTSAQGVLRLGNTALTVGQVITAAQAAQITFQPTLGFVGNATFTFSAIDNGGLYSNEVATYTIPVSGASDVSTTLAGPTVLNAGLPSGTYTATYTNNGPGVASAVTQKVTIPAGATNVLVNGVAYTPTGNVIDFGTVANLASGVTNTFTYSFTAPVTSGSVAQTSNVTTTSDQGANTGPDAATLNVTINPVADVATTVTASAASVATGQPASFTVTFTNNGPSTASNVVGTVQLPVGLAGVSATNGGTYNPNTGVVSYASATYTSGTSNSSVISFTMPGNGSVTATSTINTTTNEAGQTANDVATATINGTALFDVTTSIAGPATTVAGTMTTYSVLTINNGPSTATNIAQTVQLPTGLTNVFVSNGGTYNATTGVVTFPTLDAIASGVKVNNTVSFVAPATTFPISATVSGDTNTANNTAYLNGSATPASVAVTSASTTNANIYTTITTPSADAQPGAPITFTVVAGNKGANTATSVVERVALPAGLTGVTITGPNGASNANYDANTGVVTLPTTSLVSGATNTYTITVNAPASGMIAAVASISAATNDVMVADNVATTDVTVNASSDVATTISGPTKVNAGQNVTYTVTTTNNGMVPAANVVQTVNIPAGLTSVSLSGNGTYDPNTGIVTFPAIASQASGNTVQNTISYDAPAISSSMIIASVTSSSPDNVKANNSAAVTTTVDAIADVTVVISGPTRIVQGNQIDYLVVTTNNGPSIANSVATRVQLPAGLGAITLSTGGSYDNATGLVTFSTLATERAGQEGTITNVIRFIAPAGVSQINATASVSTTSEEATYSNNTSSIVTTEVAPTTAQTDLRTSVSSTPATLIAGQSASLSVTTTNGGGSTATGVVQRVALEVGLNITSISNGGLYDPTTGVVTFPAISLASGNTRTNTIVLAAPGTTPLQVRALVTGDQSDPTSTNNSDFLNLTVTPRADVTTTVSGPTTVAAGDAVTYSVVTLNSGPSLASDVIQRVTIPTGLTGVVVSNGGTYTASTGVVTFATITSQGTGASGQVMNLISFTAPSNSYSVVGNVTTNTTETSTSNNSSTVTVAPASLAPIANSVVNALQTPEGNTAGPLSLSPLSGTDANGNNTIANYRITSIPTTTQGVLSLNGTAVMVDQLLTATEAANLKFDPAAGFVGNAFFGYNVIDNSGLVSAAPALYTIPVGQDLNSVYTLTPAKGNTNPYVNGDIIANVFDANSGAYNNATPQAVTDTGVRTATLTSGSLPAGTALDPVTGIISVTNRLLLVGGSYPVTITTVDANGGTNSNTFAIIIGQRPLPVELKEFAVRAVKVDALLDWSTASEKNSDRFEIERSLDGTTFEKIGTVRGQGTTQATTTYGFTDAGIGAKTQSVVYYRLRQVDTDGTDSYSPVRTVRFEAQAAVTAKLSVFPNPAASSDRVVTLDLSSLPKGAYQVSLLDATGRLIGTYSVEGGVNKVVNVQTLPTGTYIVLVRGNGLNLSQRLIKE